MAFIQNNLEDDDQQQQVGSQAQGPLVGGGTQQAGTNVSQAGVGKGGTGGWTNIQAYLNANQGDTGSAQALNSEVNSQFNKERDQFSQDSSKFLNDAKTQVDSQKVTNDQANKMITDAQSQYDWGGQHKTGYQDSVNRVQGFLTGQYQGPKEYTYGFSNDTQNYANALKDNNGFDSLMNNVYSKKSNSPLTSGQYQLQKQLDVNNQALVDTRNNLQGAYGQLEKDRDNVVKDTTQKLGGYEQDYRNTQNMLKDYLTNQANQYGTKVDQAEAEARKGYADALQGKTGQKVIGWDVIQDWLAHGGAGQAVTNRANAGIWSDNLTYDQLAKEQNAFSRSQNYYAEPGKIHWLDDGANIGSTIANLDQRKRLLDNFYSQQDAKYANTGDQDERAYNAILDFLGSTDKRRAQGFKVRG